MTYQNLLSCCRRDRPRLLLIALATPLVLGCAEAGVADQRLIPPESGNVWRQQQLRSRDRQIFPERSSTIRQGDSIRKSGLVMRFTRTRVTQTTGDIERKEIRSLCCLAIFGGKLFPVGVQISPCQQQFAGFGKLRAKWTWKEQRSAEVHRMSKARCLDITNLSLALDRWSNRRYEFRINTNKLRRRFPNILPGEQKRKPETILVRSERAGYTDLGCNPGAISRLQLPLHDSNLVLSAVGLPLNLAQRFIGKESGTNSREKSDYFNKALYPFPLVLGWAFTLFGLIIGCYCWWQANFRVDSLFYYWLVGVGIGLVVFCYGLNVLVDCSLQSI